ncbi:cytochrome P450 [Syncephalis plumigaleata]|nr:cytochrome P450 [Syncephalis plumigaleata]
MMALLLENTHLTLVKYIPVVGLLFILLCLIVRRLKFTKSPGYPGPQPEFLFGNFRNVILHYGSFHQASLALHERYGDFYEFFFGFHRVYVVSDNTLIQRLITKDRNALAQNVWTVKYFSKLIPYGLIALTGNEYKRHSRLIRPFMSNSRLRASIPFMVQSMKHLVEHWQSRCCDRLYNFREDMNTLALEQLMRLLYGQQMNLFTDDLASTGRQDTQRAQQLANAVQVLFRATAEYMISLNLRVRLFGHSKQVHQAAKLLSDEVNMLREEHAQKTATSSGDTFENTSLVAILFDGDEPFTHKEICDEIFVFTMASLESVSYSYEWILYHLAGRFDVQERLRQEIAQLTGGNHPYINYDQMQPASAPYLDAVYRECIRLSYIAPAFARTTTRPIDVGEHCIPSDATIIFPVSVLHRDTRIWGSDANEFKPERWLNISLETRQSYMRAIYNFGGGERQCYGQRQATMQLKLFLAVVTFYFRLNAIPSELYTDATEQAGFLSRTACPWVILGPIMPTPA